METNKYHIVHRTRQIYVAIAEEQ